MFVCKECVKERAEEQLWWFNIKMSISYGACELCVDKKGKECIDISSDCIRIKQNEKA